MHTKDWLAARAEVARFRSYLPLLSSMDSKHVGRMASAISDYQKLIDEDYPLDDSNCGKKPRAATLPTPKVLPERTPTTSRYCQCSDRSTQSYPLSQLCREQPFHCNLQGVSLSKAMCSRHFDDATALLKLALEEVSVLVPGLDAYRKHAAKHGRYALKKFYRVAD
jgi:hypothetical protein